MKVMYNGEEIGNIITNHSMTVEQAIYCLGYDVNSKEDCEKAYYDGFPPAYCDDGYFIDIDAIEFE